MSRLIGDQEIRRRPPSPHVFMSPLFYSLAPRPSSLSFRLPSGSNPLLTTAFPLISLHRAAILAGLEQLTAAGMPAAPGARGGTAGSQPVQQRGGGKQPAAATGPSSSSAGSHHPVVVIGVAGSQALSLDDGLARCFTAAKVSWGDLPQELSLPGGKVSSSKPFHHP